MIQGLFFFLLSFYGVSVNERDSGLCKPGWMSYPASVGTCFAVCVAVHFPGSQDSHPVSQGRQPVLETITSDRTPSKVTYVRDNYSDVSRGEIIVICIF